MGVVHNLPHSLQVVNKVVAFLIVEGDDAVDGWMSLKERGNLFVEHEVYLRLWEVVAQGVEQRSGQNGIAHLAKADDEYVHGGKGREKLTVDN